MPPGRREIHRMTKKSRRVPATRPAPSQPGLRSGRSQAVAAAPPARWTFLTNHSHVLILVAQNPSVVLREVASRVGITERAVQRIIADLERAGIIERERVGRQNHYRVRTNIPLRHPIEAHRTVGDLVGII
jgi:DNA-binding transcriptional ArsR family regulator